MKKLFLPFAALLFLNACALTTDEEYIRCLQGFNDPGSGGGIPGGKAATVIAAGAAGAAAALVLCEEPEVTESPDVLDANVDGDLSQPLEAREPLLMTERVPVTPPMNFVFDSRVLQFELDRADLLPGASDMLMPVVEYLRAYPEVNARIAGHTCNLGTTEHNQSLSERRAQAAADFLMSQGIAQERLVVTGYSELEPIATNDTEEGRARNRRVEITER